MAKSDFRCECENPSCTEHTEEYQCPNKAQVFLTDDNGYAMELCQGCAESEQDQLELVNPITEALS